MQVLLVEPWYGGSHRAWADGYRRASGHDVTLVTHADRFWRWRLQGGALTLAALIAEHVERNGRPDVALVSGMVNLPALVGLARPALDGVPVALYLHENQLTYPPAPGREGRGDETTFGLVTWLSMAAADAVLVNSEHHRRSLVDALPRLLERAPDEDHLRRLDPVLERTSVLPVGIDLRRLDAGEDGARHEADEGEPIVLWCARWEHDKDPGAFAAAIDRLHDSGAPFRLAVCGERVGSSGAELEELCRRHADRVVQCGFAPEGRYRQLLGDATAVVSTARHEFFGVAVAEAVYAGAFPVLPRRLSYPELIPAAAHEACLYDDDAGLDHRLRWALSHPGEATAVAADLRPAMARFDWTEMAPRYDAVLEDVRARGSGGGAASGIRRRG